jgi:hypothetical protein
LAKRTADPILTAIDGPKVLHLKNVGGDHGLEDYLNCKIDEMQRTISTLEDQLQQQQLLLESQSRAQRLDEVLQQSAVEYEQLLQQSAEEMELLKLELAVQMQKASSQDLEATERSLQLRVESERAIEAESQRLEKLEQHLQKQLQQLREEQEEMQAQRSAIQVQASMAEAALSTVAQQQANMLVQHSQLNANSNDAMARWQLQQVSSFPLDLCRVPLLVGCMHVLSPCTNVYPIDCRNSKPKQFSTFKKI